MTTEPRAVYFRFDNDSDATVWPNSFFVIRTTPKGVWLDVWGMEKFVLNGEGRRYAYPTKDAAWESFRIRKQRQRQHLERALDELAKIEPLVALHWEDAVRRSPPVCEFFNDLEPAGSL